MLKFQKLSKVENLITFRVICDDGHEEQQSYALPEEETENALMGRVAVHINSERVKQAVDPLIEAEPAVSPIMEVSVSKTTGKISLKEVPVEPVA